MSKIKPYLNATEDTVGATANDPAVAYAKALDSAMPNGIPHANIENGILQVTPDIENEISETESGETVSMYEFKSMFSKWLD